MSDQTSGKTILIVEDDDFFADLMVRQLTQGGYRPLRAKSGEEGIELAISEKPALVTIDLALPGISGLELVARLKQEDATKDIPFMVFSNSDEQEMRQESTQLGAAAYFVKAQFTPRELFERIDGFVSKLSAA